ncbi:MAG: DUF1360 domain-containing protein [Chloroflexi bacterium]|jgi:uncharacterized membrane protein|nr:DUF1360 domain-containing protein [Chloroflexota bacterium]
MRGGLTHRDRQEYATKLTLIGVFISIFTAFANRMSRPGRREMKTIGPFDLVLLGLATLRLGRLVSYDLIAEPLRRPFTRTVPDETGAGDTVAPRDESGLKRSLGQLISCPICSGTWIAAALVYGLHLLPNATRLFLAVFSTTGLAEILNALTEALSWTGQYARTLTGENGRSQHDDGPDRPARKGRSGNLKGENSMGDVVTKSIIVKADPETVYRFWSDFENFPLFMKNIESVQNTGGKMSHWKMKGPLGKTLEWDAETTLLEPNQRIAWSTKDHGDGDLTTSGQVTFMPLPERGETQITVMLQYEPKAGLAGDVAEKLFANPEKMLDEDLRNFKDYIEGRYERTA